MKRRTLAALAAAGLCATMGPASAKGFYQLEKAITLPGQVSGWDYLAFDATRNRLFVGRRAEGAAVYDAAAHRVVKVIEDSKGANAIILVPEFDRAYTVNGDGSSTVFQLSTLNKIDRIKLGDDADAGLYEPVTKQIAVTMGDSKQIAFLDARTGRRIAILKMESEKLEAAQPDGKGGFFVAQRDRNAVAHIDARKHTVLAEYPTKGCDEPTGLAFDAAHHRLFVGCRGAKPVLGVLDSETGATVTTLEIGRGNDGVIYDAGEQTIFSSNGIDANLVLYRQIDADHYELLEALTTRPLARTMALDPVTKRLFVATAEGTVDPTQKINRAVAPFYANRFFPDSFAVLTFARR
ncbi:YncE family protein [Roseiterribacter gracilis]|uniref:Uncharacterized protein n=1 Tax=Roseiterribacter gracilis TaxID=2812848 RepID=A0A8S8XCG4_9PROT|nr:hypothetical protein TMPK1_33800 [Rhodospirillales bacterium TMPK1]